MARAISLLTLLLATVNVQGGIIRASAQGSLKCLFSLATMECGGELVLEPLMSAIDRELTRLVVNATAVESLLINLTSLTSLEDGFFSPTSLTALRSLRLSNGNLSRVHPGAFEGIGASLRFLDLSRGKLKSVPSVALGDIDHLENLSMAHNLVEVLSSEAFANQTELVALDLSSNAISMVSVGTFYHLRNLSVLDLSHNKLSTFDSSAFGNNTHLSNLSLASNGLQSVSLDNSTARLTFLNLSENRLNDTTIMLELPQLQSLHLQGNSLKGAAFLKPLTSLQHLSLAHNPLGVLDPAWFSSLAKLEVLDLNNCSIQRLVEGSFSQLGMLRKLNLSGNGISIADSRAFLGLTALTELDLSRNRLTYINWNHTKDLQSLSWLDLSHNSIQYIFNGAFSNSPNLTSLLLQGNLLDCSCELIGFAKLLKARLPSKEAICDDSATAVVDFNFDSLACPTDRATTETTPYVSESPNGIQSVGTTSAMQVTTGKTTTVLPFQGHIMLVQVQLGSNDNLSLTWNAYSGQEPLSSFQCLVSIGIASSKVRNNLTRQCPPDTRNQTFLVNYILPKFEYEICLAILRGREEMLRNCSKVHPTHHQTAATEAPHTTLSSQTTEASTSTTTNQTVQAYTSTTSQATQASTSTTTGTPVWAGTTATVTDDRDEFRYRLNFTTHMVSQDELVVTWTLSPPTRPGSNCRLNVTLLEDKDVLTRTEVPCSSGGQLTVGHISSNKDYDVCFSKGTMDLPADCRQIPPTKLALSRGASNVPGRPGVTMPVALLVMIAAMVLVAVIAAILLVLHKRRQQRVVARRKVGESIFHLQMNRRSGSYAVQTAAATRDSSRIVTSCSTSQDGGKVSQRSSSVDEL